MFIIIIYRPIIDEPILEKHIVWIIDMLVVLKIL